MKKFLLLFICLTLIASVFAQYQNVMISDQSWPNEPSISMDPNNPLRLVAAANINKYFVSDDGGFSWTLNYIESESFGVAGDPCIIVDTAGDFYYLHLSSPTGGSWLDRIVCQKFDFENNEWTDGSFMGFFGEKDQDKEWAVVDSATNNIYVTWTQFDKYGSDDPYHFSNILFSKSTDAGESWSEAIQINEVSGGCLDDDNTTEGAVPTVGPNGEIFVAWSGPEGIVFDRSYDQGETWLDEDIFVNSQPTGWVYDIPGISRCNGLPITCCDISYTETRGTIYVNWTDQRNGTDDTDVWLSKSLDNGNTWSEAVRVNDDAPGRQQFLTWMTIDQTNGDILIVFYDRRNHEDKGTDVYLARSTDAGETFENIQISESPFYPSASVFFGDYNNITAHDGVVRPIWTRAESTSLSMWTAIIDLTVDVPETQGGSPLSLAQNYPNPFRESTFISFKILKDENVNLVVYDVYGRKVTNLINNEHYQIGKYEINFNPSDYNLKSGVYYFVLSTHNNLQKKKMLLVD